MKRALKMEDKPRDVSDNGKKNWTPFQYCITSIGKSITITNFLSLYFFFEIFI